MGEYYVNTDIPSLTTPLTSILIVTTDIPVVTANNTDLVVAKVVRNIPVINQTIQSLLLILILMAALLTNFAIILNISRDSLKLRMVHFLLIRHVCITDSVGAIFVLPVPLVSFIKGYWDFSDAACSVISTTTACCWTMHLVAVALYRADRVFAVWLPTGRYPVISARIVHVLLVLIWMTVLTGSYIATITFTPAFQPALALCLPNVPLVFFILVFACYCLGLVTLTTGYVFAFIRRRRKRKKKKRLQTLNAPTNLNSPTSKSAPQLHQTPTTTDFCNNNRVVLATCNPNPNPPNTSNKSPRSVNFEEATISSANETPSTSNNSCNTRPLTPPYVPKPRPQTHRRTHSDGVQINAIIASSHESVLSVQYRTLSKRSHDSSESYDHEHCVEEGVAEKLDECDGVSGVVSSSNTTSEREREDRDQGTQYTTAESKKRSRAARCRIFASYAVSIGHLILYLPAMVTVALIGVHLPPGVAFLCGLIVYAEFIVQPTALLCLSPRLCHEVVQMVRSYIRLGTSVPQACASSSVIHQPHNEASSTAAENVVVDMETNDLNSSPKPDSLKEKPSSS